MSNVKSVTKSVPRGAKGKVTGTDTLLQSQTVRTRDTMVQPVKEDSLATVGTTGLDITEQVRAGLSSTEGLVIEPVAGGLYKVRSLGGGVAPSPMGPTARFTELGALQKMVYAYNIKVR